MQELEHFEDGESVYQGPGGEITVYWCHGCERPYETKEERGKHIYGEEHSAT